MEIVSVSEDVFSVVSNCGGILFWFPEYDCLLSAMLSVQQAYEKLDQVVLGMSDPCTGKDDNLFPDMLLPGEINYKMQCQLTKD